MFTALDTVYEWHRLPSEFGLCRPEQDLSMMTAYLEAKRIVDRTESEIQKQEAEEKEKHAGKPKRKGQNS